MTNAPPGGLLGISWRLMGVPWGLLGSPRLLLESPGRNPSRCGPRLGDITSSRPTLSGALPMEAVHSQGHETPEALGSEEETQMSLLESTQNRPRINLESTQIRPCTSRGITPRGVLAQKKRGPPWGVFRRLLRRFCHESGMILDRF
jgi:hypothetical protein